MTGRSKVNLEELKHMDPVVFNFIDGISEEQALDSDIEGDSDADDNFPMGPTPSTPKSRKRDHEEISDFSSDDSITDPNFLPKRKKKFPRNATIASSSDEDDELSPKPLQSEDGEYKWTKNPYLPHIFEAVTFTSTSAPKLLVSKSPLENFLNIFGEDLLNIIVTESNRYAGQKGTSLDLSLNELKAFIGILVIMGLNSLSSLRLYWPSNQNFHSARVSEAMPLKRFLKILRYLHIHDNDLMPKKGEPEFDKLYKIRPMIQYLTNSFLQAYTPGRNIAIDESMVAFKGRTHLKQYMPQKPIKREFKIWALACSEIGYLLNFSVYEGKKEGGEEGMLGEGTVLELTQPFQDKYYCAYFNNFFTSFSWLSRLLERKIFGCGKVRTNRKNFPRKELVSDKRLCTGESDSVGNSNITGSKWKDRGNKCVVVASTMHSTAERSTVNRMTKEGVRVQIACPKSIDDYNRNMGRSIEEINSIHVIV
ncbi:hypothetical protein ILUMI_19888 [Ignelater luminosus]|uniref:PiggyBac transposable element-derived protein domain-containing protein n=1 Tax=Ignelater luminosus TaxID=2038154 RepID=A0A8K0CM19_IGNLU|nr:hypothetical protein ILUMI_19888 [Ignelater luminosus]